MNSMRVATSLLGLFRPTARVFSQTILRGASLNSPQYCSLLSRQSTMGSAWQAIHSQRNYGSRAAKRKKILNALFRPTGSDVAGGAATNRDQTGGLKKWGWSLLAPGLLSIGIWAAYELHKSLLSEDGDKIEYEYIESSVVSRNVLCSLKSADYYGTKLIDPTQVKLLPDPMKPPGERSGYTLVFELSDLVVHPDWTYHSGWRLKKGPGEDDCLQKYVQHFESIIFSDDTDETAFPLIDEIDPDEYARYRLVRYALCRRPSFEGIESFNYFI